MKTTDWAPLILVVGVLLVFLQQPFSLPDELQHLARAYQISEGQFIVLKLDNRIGSWVPQSLLEVALRSDEDQHWLLPTSSVEPTDAANHDEDVFFDHPQNALYSPVPYFPQAVGVLAARYLGFGPMAWLLFARLVNLIVWLALVVAAIHILPMARPLAILIASFPHSLMLAASASADALNFALITLFLASVLRLWVEPRGSVWFIFCASSITFPLCKVAYAPLLLCALPLFFKATTQRWKSLVWVICLGSIMAAAAWATVSRDLYIPRHQYHPIYRIYLPLTEAPSATEVLVSVLRQPENLLASIALTFTASNRASGSLGPKLPSWLWMAWLLELGLFLVVGDRALDRRVRVLWAVLGLGTVLAILALMYGLQDVSVVAVIGAMQSRYLIPLVFPISMCCLFRGRVPVQLFSWLHLVVQTTTWLIALPNICRPIIADSPSAQSTIVACSGWTIEMQETIALPFGLQIEPITGILDEQSAGTTYLDERGQVSDCSDARSLWREGLGRQQYACRVLRLKPADSAKPLAVWCFNPRRIYQQISIPGRQLELAPHTGIWLQVNTQQTIRGEGLVIHIAKCPL